MINDLFFTAIGVALGWFFLPTPQWATNLVAKIPGISAYLKK